MKTKQAITKYAYGLAQSHFYSDDNTPWEPFQNYEEGWLQENVDDLGRAIERAMLWAQEEGGVMKTYSAMVCFRSQQLITVKAEDEDAAKRLMAEEFKATNDNTELDIWDFEELQDEIQG